MEQGRGLNVYFGHNFYNSRGGLGGLRSGTNKYGEKKETILVDIGQQDETVDIFLHEFSHYVHEKMCDSPHNDIEFAGKNTEEYTEVFQGNEDVQLYGFKTPYGAVNVQEDFATIAEEVLDWGAQSCYDEEDGSLNPVVCEKEKLILARLNAINPEIADYYIARAEFAYRGVKESNPLFEYKPSPYLSNN